MFKVNGITNAKKKLDRSKKDLDRLVAKRVQLAAQYVHISVTSLTAVWMGTSLANWIWSVNSPSGIFKGASGTGAPGLTSQMSLGEEPRRAANQAVADASFKSIKFNPKDPYHCFYLSNNDPKISAMEAGRVPDSSRARTSDMVKMTHRGLIDYINSMRI
jgi:hypothetical protein